jgi:hypothetical protein
MFDGSNTQLWLPIDDIQAYGMNGGHYRLVNKDEGEVAGATFLGFG